MAGQFYFSFLNPAIACTFAAVFFMLWTRFRAQSHLLLIVASFCLVALGFLGRDFQVFANENLTKFSVNVAFVGGFLLACMSALHRVDLRTPRIAFGLTLLAGFVVFTWYLIADPWTVGRVLALGVTMAGLALTTFVLLNRQPVRRTSDRMIAMAALIGAAMSLARPILALMGVLSVEDAVSFQNTTYWVTIQAFTPILTGTVALLFLAALSIDMFEQIRAEANHDYLTGLLNRRGFEANVVTSLDETSAGRPALIVADIDNFKLVNDTYGHKVGDQVIAGIALALKQNGKAMYAARVGGEEYALYYQGDDLGLLQRHADDVRAAVRRLVVPGLPSSHKLTLSFGIHVRSEGETLSDMLIEADRALYRAKAAGKDQAVMTPSRFRTVEPMMRLA